MQKLKKTIQNKRHLRIIEELLKEPSNSLRLAKKLNKDQSTINIHMKNMLLNEYIVKINNSTLYKVTDKFKFEIKKEIKKINLEIYKKTIKLQKKKERLENLGVI